MYHVKFETIYKLLHVLALCEVVDVQEHGLDPPDGAETILDRFGIKN